MSRLIFLLPAVFVALLVIITFSLYMNSREHTLELAAINSDLKRQLAEISSELAEQTSANKELENRLATMEEQAADRRFTLRKGEKEPLHGGNHISNLEQADPVNRPRNDSSVSERQIATKIASISKFVPLSDEQRSRLTQKFRLEAQSKSAETETLDQIIGTDEAAFYREQRKKAFERILQESIEKEVMFIARKLALSPAEEESLRSVYFEVEGEISKMREENAAAEKEKSTLQKLIEEEKLRNDLLVERLKEKLSPDNFDTFIRYQAGAQEMQLWHE